MENAQELIQRLNHSGKKLSKSHRRIAECIVSHYDKVVFMTASKLGEYVGVSESTVVRFAAALGYSGYPQLQKALQELIRHRLTASQRFEMTSDMDHAQVLNKVLKADIMNIRSTLDELDLNAFEKAIDRIIQARAIYVLGLRASAPIAEFFVHYLEVHLQPTSRWSLRASATYSSSFPASARTTCSSASPSPAIPARTIEAMEFARSRGAELIAITDGPLSPLHSTADVCLMAKSDMASFVDSFAAPLSLINALIVALSQRRRQEVSEHFTELESIWANYDVYLAKSGE